MRLIGLLLVFAGCEMGPPPPADSTPLPDTTETLGVFVSWDADPSLPGPVSDKISVSVAAFRLEYLQVLSDLPASERTTRSTYQLRWDSTGTPSEDTFPAAPLATYRRVSISLQPTVQDPAYEIIGMWKDDDDEARPFRIVDRMPLPQIAIMCDKPLVAGGKVSIPIKVDVKDAVTAVDFKRVQPDVNGVLVVDGGMQLAVVRTKISKVFSLEDED